LALASSLPSIRRLQASKVGLILSDRGILSGSFLEHRVECSIEGIGLSGLNVVSGMLVLVLGSLASSCYYAFKIISIGIIDGFEY
jgi:hypothetical protein